MMNGGYVRQIVRALGGGGSRANQSLPQVFDLGHPGFRTPTCRRTAALLAFLLPGCGTGIPEQLPAPAIPEVQIGIVAGRYLLGGYPDVIDSTRHQPFVVYHWRYTQAVTLWSLLLLHEQTQDPMYLGQVRASLESYEVNDRIRVDGGGEPIDDIGAMAHTILEYSLLSEDESLLAAALEAARYFHEDAPRTPEGLLAHHSDPEGGRIWADALFMVAPLMAKAGTVLGDQTYYDDVLAQFRGFSERLRDPAVGLFHQGWGWDGPGASPGYWCRANGWVALAMTEVLDALPVDYPGRDELLASYQGFIAAIVDHQGTGGMWHQLLNRYDPDSYEETSSTAMFIYALSEGVRRGWLRDEYVTAIDEAHRGLSRKISLTGNIAGICPGCSTKSSEQGYLDKRPDMNDPHGIGPVLLALYGILSLSQS